MSDSFVDFINVVIINVSLSSDNVVVICMAAASLPRNQRNWAILLGGCLAIALRISLTAGAGFLMMLPLLSAVGGLVLIWVAHRLLKLDVGEGDTEKRTRVARNFGQAVFLVAVSDLMMSLENILAVAGAAHGNLVPLIAGLFISMALLMTIGSLVSRLIEKFAWLPFLGAVVICFTGTRMIFEDKFLVSKFPVSSSLVIVVSVTVGLAVPLIIHLINKRKGK